MVYIFIAQIEIPIVHIVRIQFPGRAEYLGQLSLEVRFTPVSSAGDFEIRQIQRKKGIEREELHDHRVLCQPLFSEFIAKTHIFRDLSPYRPCQELLRIMLQPGGEEAVEKKGSHGQANSPFKWVSS